MLVEALNREVCLLNTDVLVKHRKVELFEDDLPEERFQHYMKKSMIAVDTETRGLIIRRDRLCLVQICDDEGIVSFVRYKDKDSFPHNSYVKKLMEAPNVTKLFHYARFDVSVMKHYLGAETKPIFCTKVASKLIRTYTDRHSLKDLVRELLQIELDKTDQSSDWARSDLSESQIEYAANDVRVLIPIHTKILHMLEREDRLELAERSFEAVRLVCDLDLKGFQNVFEH